MEQKVRAIVAAAVGLAVWAAPAVAAPGDLDPSFSTDGYDIRDVFGADDANDVVIQPDGKIVVAGTSSVGGNTRMSAIRYLPNGELDPQFGSGGKAAVVFSFGASTFSTIATSVALQSDGRIVLAGNTRMHSSGNGADANGLNFAVARLKPDGTVDSSFNTSGVNGNSAGRLVVSMAGADDRAQDVAIAPNGSIFVAGSGSASGTDTDFWTLKVTPDGYVDSSFGAAGKSQAGLEANSFDTATALALQSDGRIVLVGQTTPNTGADPRWAIVRLKTDGFFDPSFDGDGKRIVDFPGGTESAADVAIDANGRIVVAGTTRLNSNRDVAVARLDPAAGADDPTFGSGGKLTVDSGRNELGRGMALTPSGEIVVVGEAYVTGEEGDAAVTRVLPRGALDPGFGQAGIAVHDLGGSEFPSAAAVQPGGAIVVAGGFDEVPGHFMTLRLQGVALPQTGGPPAEDTTGPGPGPAPGQVADTTLPGFASFAVTPSFRAAATGDSVAAARARAGAKVSYALTEPAQVSFTVERPVAGRKVGRDCVKPAKKNRKRKRCTRYVALKGSFTHAGKAGANSLKFTGRLRNRKLTAGPYRLVAVATDAAGNKSAAKRAKFRIVRR
jgi:uncharacterized delta-60 repeat protein